MQSLVFLTISCVSLATCFVVNVHQPRTITSGRDGLRSSISLFANYANSSSFVATNPALLLFEDNTLVRIAHKQRQALEVLVLSSSTPSKETSISTRSNPTAETAVESDDTSVVTARVLLLGAAALYGTNFSLVKLVGDIIPSVGVSSVLRFGLAALVTMPWLVQPSKEGREVMIGSTLAGLEVGMWNSIGYVAQAIGLETTEASKVSVCLFIHFRTGDLFSRF
jgi:hypothetical protein